MHRANDRTAEQQSGWPSGGPSRPPGYSTHWHQASKAVWCDWLGALPLPKITLQRKRQAMLCRAIDRGRGFRDQSPQRGKPRPPSALWLIVKPQPGGRDLALLGDRIQSPVIDHPVGGAAAGGRVLPPQDNWSGATVSNCPTELRLNPPASDAVAGV